MKSKNSQENKGDEEKMSGEKLKTCPFCGGQARIREDKLDGEKFFYVECDECSASTPLVDDKDFVADVWNERADLVSQNDEDILSCPFCAHNAEVGEIEIEGDIYYAVICEECGIHTQGSDKASDVIEFWNKRS